MWIKIITYINTIQLVIVHPRKFQKIFASLTHWIHLYHHFLRNIWHANISYICKDWRGRYGRIIEIFGQESDKYYRNKQLFVGWIGNRGWKQRIDGGLTKDRQREGTKAGLNKCLAGWCSRSNIWNAGIFTNRETTSYVCLRLDPPPPFSPFSSDTTTAANRSDPLFFSFFFFFYFLFFFSFLVDAHTSRTRQRHGPWLALDQMKTRFSARYWLCGWNLSTDRCARHAGPRSITTPALSSLFSRPWVLTRRADARKYGIEFCLDPRIFML